MCIAAPSWRFDLVSASGLAADSAEVGRELGRALAPSIAADSRAILLAADALTCNFDSFAAGLAETLPPEPFVPILGATASDDWQMQKTYQYAGARALTDGASALLLSGDLQLAWASSHGCVTVGSAREITAAQANCIQQIDRKPVLEVLGDYLVGHERDDWDRTSVDMALALQRDDQPEPVIRALMQVDAAQGQVAIATDAPVGTPVWLARRDARKIANGVIELAGQLKGQLGDREPKLVLQFDCAGRGKAAFREDQVQQLVALLQQTVAPNVPWIGSYTYGEIAPVERRNSFHNYTAVVAVIS